MASHTLKRQLKIIGKTVQLFEVTFLLYIQAGVIFLPETCKVIELGINVWFPPGILHLGSGLTNYTMHVTVI